MISSYLVKSILASASASSTVVALAVSQSRSLKTTVFVYLSVLELDLWEFLLDFFLWF